MPGRRGTERTATRSAGPAAAKCSRYADGGGREREEGGLSDLVAVWQVHTVMPLMLGAAGESGASRPLSAGYCFGLSSAETLKAGRVSGSGSVSLLPWLERSLSTAGP